MKLEELVRQLELAYGEGLRSVVLFGSAVAGEHTKKSDYNVLVVVDALPLERLRAVAAVSKAWADDGNPPPMTFTTKEFKSSAEDRKSTRLNSSHLVISYAVFCLKKKNVWYMAEFIHIADGLL